MDVLQYYIPKIADCGGLIIGVESIDPNTPPLVMVKVPPNISLIVIFPSLALLPLTSLFQILPLENSSVPFLTTGTINPFTLTAIPISV